MTNTKILQEKLSKKIEDHNKDINILVDLNQKYKNIDFSEHIKLIQEKRDNLIATQNYLVECEDTLGDLLENWLDNECKGEIKMSLVFYSN